MRVLRFDAAGAPAHDDDPLAMLTASPMSWVTKNHGLALGAQNLGHSSDNASRVWKSSAGEARRAADVGLGQSVRASAARWRMPPDSWLGARA